MANILQENALPFPEGMFDKETQEKQKPSLVFGKFPSLSIHYHQIHPMKYETCDKVQIPVPQYRSDFLLSSNKSPACVVILYGIKSHSTVIYWKMRKITVIIVKS